MGKIDWVMDARKDIAIMKDFCLDGCLGGHNFRYCVFLFYGKLSQ